MKAFMKSMKWKMMLFGVLTLLIGVALVANPDTAARTIVMILAIVLAAAGAISMLMYVVNKNKEASSMVLMGSGVVEFVCGIVIALNLDTFISFIGILFGIVLMIHGINDLVQAISLKRMGYKAGTFTIVSGVLAILLAVLICVNPFDTASALMMLIGISLIIDGASDIAIAFRVGHYAKQYVEVDPDKVVEIDPEDVEVEDDGCCDK